MSLIKLSVITVSTAIIFSGCSALNFNKEFASNNIRIPETVDENAKEKAETHSKIGKTIFEIGVEMRNFKENYKMEQSPARGEKLNASINQAFTKSEELRKIFETKFQGHEEVKTEFESAYLPALDALIISYKKTAEQDFNADQAQFINDEFTKYYSAHNQMTEVLNRNLYY
jgi:hypothetical protein